MANALATYRNEEDATESRVFLIDRGYSAVLVDLDSGETIPYVRIFPTFDAADAVARSYVGAAVAS